ncbi:uncharacterized protein LOC34622471 [Cyclospora cayetanensis]|uniref:Uncharacterized protein LOC34622471 n=1 Tax=Cyclospora cayetanensis TaxID=88456 RepID=A0A6P6RY94_9EIME|nr:uncharacterized protein LOC34622471 [Cyclospora cayetanensis]
MFPPWVHDRVGAQRGTVSAIPFEGQQAAPFKNQWRLGAVLLFLCLLALLAEAAAVVNSGTHVGMFTMLAPPSKQTCACSSQQPSLRHREAAAGTNVFRSVSIRRAASATFLSPTVLQQWDLRGRCARSRSSANTSLCGSRSNRINGKRPSVLPSPSPFPAALLHLLSGNSKARNSSSLPNEVYVGQHVRIPVTPSSDLSLAKLPRGPPRLFSPDPIRLDARGALVTQGLPLTRLRWPQDAEQQQQQQNQPREEQSQLKSVYGEPLTFECLCERGDRHPEKKTFGEEAPLFKHHLHFGSPPWPNAIIQMAKEYNAQVREDGKEEETVPEEWICDTLFCDERGRVLRVQENSAPYGGEDEPESGATTWELFKLRTEQGKKQTPHRFVVTAPAGYVAEAGITVGDQLPMLSDEQLETVYNNHFALPQNFREPLILPDGTCIP